LIQEQAFPLAAASPVLLLASYAFIGSSLSFAAHMPEAVPVCPCSSLYPYENIHKT
jgi:hypothetical protein